LRKETYLHPSVHQLIVKAHPEVITFLYDEEGERLDELERQLRKRIFLRATPGFHHEQYEISADGIPQNSAQPSVTKAQEATPTPRQRAIGGASGGR
jgi:hypothetical protein